MSGAYDAVGGEVPASWYLELKAENAALIEALTQFAALYEEEWPENTEHNKAACKRMVLSARDALAAARAGETT